MPNPSPDINDFHALEPAALLARYTISVEHFDRRVFELKDDQLDMAFLPDSGVGQWPIRVLLGHLADAELAFVFRMRLVVAEAHPILQPWDENAFIDSGLYTARMHDAKPAAERGGGGGGGGATQSQPIGGPIAAVHTLRKWHTDWLRSLEPAQWQRTGLHPQRGEQSVKTILTYATWHLEHHATFLNAKVRKFLGPAKQLINEPRA